MPSFRLKRGRLLRQTIDVEKVTAGSNAEKTANSLDDNELSEWLSDGKLENAWIKYEFSESKTINHVVLKLVGWRTQSYPLQILIDGKQVYLGTTPRSLGYVTLSFPATSGKSVTIKLNGEASNRDAFGNIIEITGTPDASSSANKGGKSILGIVEAEFYTN